MASISADFICPCNGPSVKINGFEIAETSVTVSLVGSSVPITMIGTSQVFGGVVDLCFDPFSFIGTGTTLTTSPLAVALRPSAQRFVPCSVYHDDLGFLFGYITIGTDGVMKFYAATTLDVWSAATHEIYATDVSYEL